jgi:predicted transglutaminase-like protease
MSTYTGSLQPKKKSELQEIAIALEIRETGTREEIQNRIKSHLADNEEYLSEDPRFSGLYSRNRKRSVQPQAAP